MVVQNTRAFVKGLILLGSFVVVLVTMFSPIFNGRNALEEADELFNSISKGSVYFFPDLLKKNEAFKDTGYEVTLGFTTEELAAKAETVLSAAKVQTLRSGDKVTAKGNLGETLGGVIRDSEAMFANKDEALSKKYGLSGKEVLFVWWNTLKKTDSSLTKQKQFKQAAFVSEVNKKSVEVGYNFFSIESAQARSKAGILTFSMVFYVMYTLWYGVGILYLFEGFGMHLKAKPKKEI